MMDSPAEIARIVERAAGDCPGLPSNQLSTFLTEITKWNDQMSLVSKTSTMEVMARLVPQSSAMWELAMEVADSDSPSFVDVGGGAGFPGVIWALQSPLSRALFVERRMGKASFLERMVTILPLANVEVVGADAREAYRGRKDAGSFDLGSAIAVGPPGATGLLLEPFLVAGGHFITSGPRSPDEAPNTVGSLRLIRTESVDNGTYWVYEKHR